MTDLISPTTHRDDDVPAAADGPTRPSGLRRVAALSASLVGTYAVTGVLGLLFWLVAARQSTLGAVGVAGAAVAAMMLLGALGTCGLGTLLIARLPVTPQGDRRVLVRTALAVAGAGGALLALLVPLAAVVGPWTDAVRPIAGTPGLAVLFAAGTASTAVVMVVDQAVLVLGDGRLQLERNTAASSVKLVALLGLALAGETGGMAIFLAWTVGTLVSLPLVAWRTRGGRVLAHPGPLLDRRVLRGLGRAAASHHALNTTLQAPLQLLPLLVLVGISAQDNGVFSASLQVTGVIFALPFAITVALFASAEGRERDVLDRMRLTLPLCLGISLLANLLLLPLAGPVLSVFGAEYSDRGVDVLRLLALAGIPFVVKDHFVALRRVQGRTTAATGVLLGLAVLELAAAAAGAAVAGVVGLCAAWLAVLALEALVLGWPLLAAARRARTVPVPAASTGRAQTAGATAGGTTVLSTRGPLRRAVGVLGVGPVLLLMTLGLLAVAEAVASARTSGSGSDARSELLYVVGLVLIVLPAAVVTLLPRVAPASRVLLALAAMVLLQLTRLVVDPTRFVLHNELIHLNGLRLLEQGGRLYAENPLLPVTSYYPGLQVATAAVHDLTGLGDHASGVVVLLAARVVLALGVLAVVGHVSGSARVGAAAVLVYACNPQLLVFNASFNYQSLALPLAALTVYLVLSRRPGSRLSLLPALLALAAVTASHHLTAALLVLVFVLWALLERVVPRARDRAAGAPALMALAGTVLLGLTLLAPGNPLVGYLGEIATSSLTAVEQVAGGGETRALFQNSAGVQSEPWERGIIVVSQVLTLGVLLLALWAARRLLADRRAIVVLLLGVALLFPLIPASHLTPATAEVGDRSAGFVYLGVAFVVAWWFWRRPPRALRAVALGLGVTVLFVGGVVLGSGSISSQLPGPFRVSDDARSVDADALAAADWMAANLPRDSVVYADRVGGLLAAAYGEQYVVRHVSTRVDASRLLLDPEHGPADVALVREAGIRYLVADRRDAFGLPNQGIYIESGEFEEARTTPVPVEALRKFSDVPGVDVVYDNGSVVVYDLEALRGD